MAKDARSSRRILIVEDDPFARRALATLLTLQGHEVISAASAPEAIDLLGGETQFTHVLMDLLIGEPDGTAVLSRLRTMRHQARVAVISGTSDQELISRAMSFAPDRFFTKPLEIQRLLDWIRDSGEAGA
jgi:CheY-like chemotaxis protein